MKKTYRVTGGSRVAGYAPGETFQADYRPDLERALIQGGAIEVVETAKPAAKKRRHDSEEE